jgi:uncharacterized protein (DUF305 family)
MSETGSGNDAGSEADDAAETEAHTVTTGGAADPEVPSGGDTEVEGPTDNGNEDGADAEVSSGGDADGTEAEPPTENTTESAAEDPETTTPNASDTDANTNTVADGNSETATVEDNTDTVVDSTDSVEDDIVDSVENNTDVPASAGSTDHAAHNPDAGPVGTPPPVEAGHTSGSGRRQLPALMVLGAVAILLLGVVVGLLLRISLENGDDNTPAADSAAVGFAQDMIRHHQQAAAMATLELYGGADPQVRTLAYDILTSQTNQVGQMQSWLTRWDYPLNNPGEAMAWMEGHGDGHSHGGSTEPSMAMGSGDADAPPMPGMATTAEMAKLGTLQGAELDTYFLQLMLRHHQGAKEMMEFAVERDHVQEEFVRQLAQQMINVQQSESDTMTQMLGYRGAQPLPMN